MGDMIDLLDMDYGEPEKAAPPSTSSNVEATSLASSGGGMDLLSLIGTPSTSDFSKLGFTAPPSEQVLTSFTPGS